MKPRLQALSAIPFGKMYRIRFEHDGRIMYSNLRYSPESAWQSYLKVKESLNAPL